MAITPAERRGYDERINQTREEAETRETQVNKQRAEELKRMEKRHDAEMRSLIDDYDKRIADIQGRDRETLTERDVKHRQDVEDLKAASMAQLRKKMEESASLRHEMEETYKADLDKEKSVHQVQQANLTDRQTDELQAKDEHFARSLSENHEKLERAIAKNRNELEAGHEKETNLIRKDRDDSVMRKEADIHELRKAYKNDIERLKRGKEDSENRWGEKYYDTIQNLQAGHSEEMKTQKELLAEEFQNQQDKFHQRLDEKSAQIDHNNDLFQKTVTDRQNTEVRGRDSKIKGLETKLTNQMIQDDRRSSVEKANIVRAYEARMNDLDRQKNEMGHEFKDLADDRVSRLVHENDHLLGDATREHRDQVNLMTSRNREDRAALIGFHEDQEKQSERTTDQRIRKMKKNTDDEIKTMSEHYDEALESVKDGYSERVDAQRDAGMEERTRATSAMTNRFRDMENKYQQRFDLTVDGYETKLAQQKENSEKELKRMQTVFEQRLNELKKGQKLEKESIEQKYQAKMAVSEASHQEELDHINRRHEEEMRTAVTRAANTYSRKA